MKQNSWLPMKRTCLEMRIPYLSVWSWAQRNDNGVMLMYRRGDEPRTCLHIRSDAFNKYLLSRLEREKNGASEKYRMNVSRANAVRLGVFAR
jgi:hypothetical protein